MLCFYVSPIIVYVIGSFYVYNLNMIGMAETYSFNLETKMIQHAEAYKLIPIAGWQKHVQKYNSKAKYMVYSFFFFLFGLYPSISIVLGHTYILFKTGKPSPPETLNLYLSWIIPIVLNAIYLALHGYQWVKNTHISNDYAA